MTSLSSFPVLFVLLLMLMLSSLIHNSVMVAVSAVSADHDESENQNKISYNQRSFIINGQPKLLLSGSVHYTRVPPKDWDHVFKLAKSLGLNCIQTYVFWNEHEKLQGQIDWGDSNNQAGGELMFGYNDIMRFIDLAAENDLYVVVRIGPYICGEYYFGGLPLWLRNLEGIECFRCMDKVWRREMERWTRTVVDKIRPKFITNGGPIMLLQIENEYSHADEYAKWSIEMARNISTELPWEMCHNVPQCMELNNEAGGHQNEMLCAINGFWMDTGGAGGQPGPDFFNVLWNHDTNQPKQPALWTEDQGWFDIWGYGKRVRWISDQLYGIARFIAYGGSYHNFYMLTGGNNYGRIAGRDATTGYASDTVIDNLLLRHEPKFTRYQHFFHILQQYECALLNHPPAKPIQLSTMTGEGGIEAHEYGRLVFLSNTNEEQFQSGYVKYKDQLYFLTNHSVVILTIPDNGGGNGHCRGKSGYSSSVLFNTSSTIIQTSSIEENLNNQNKEKHLRFSNPLLPSVKQEPSIPITNWKYFKEQVGYGAIKNGPGVSPEQLNITNNDSDYLWYTFWISANTTLTVQPEGEMTITVNKYGWDGIHYVYVNGKETNQLYIPDPSIEGAVNSKKNLQFGSSKLMLASLSFSKKDPHMTISSSSTFNDHLRIDILSVAMGLSNVAPGPSSTKGVINVTNACTRSNPFGTRKHKETMTYTQFWTQWVLLGEEMKVYTNRGSSSINWTPIPILSLYNDFQEEGTKTVDYLTDSLIWLQGNFDLPDKYRSFAGKSLPDQTGLVANLTGLNKGVAYVNGFNIGRYWLKNGECVPSTIERHHSSNEDTNAAGKGEDPNCAPPRHGPHCYIHWKGCNRPTQDLYHIPFQVLLPTNNLITFFEESSRIGTNMPARNLKDVKLQILHHHPDG